MRVCVCVLLQHMKEVRVARVCVACVCGSDWSSKGGPLVISYQCWVYSKTPPVHHPSLCGVGALLPSSFTQFVASRQSSESRLKRPVFRLTGRSLTWPWPGCLPVCLSASLPVCLSGCLAACLPGCLSACLPSACLSVCLSACLPVWLTG